MLLRLTRAYGTRLASILKGAASLDDLGECLGANLYEAELRYLILHEYARTGDDVLWRRSKLGLHLPADAQARVGEWMAANATETADFA